MDKMRVKRRGLRYWRTHSTLDAVARAGRRVDVARAWGEAPGTIRHKATNPQRLDPTFRAAHERAEELVLAGCTARPLADAILATERRVRIVEADPADLIEHGCNLLDSECAYDGNEDRAQHLAAEMWLEALDSGLPLLGELRDVTRYLLDVHGVDLLEEWRARRAG